MDETRTGRVRFPSREELQARRERLLAATGLDRGELERRAGGGLLSGEVFWLWEAIRSVEWLLGDDRDG